MGAGSVFWNLTTDQLYASECICRTTCKHSQFYHSTSSLLIVVVYRSFVPTWAMQCRFSRMSRERKRPVHTLQTQTAQLRSQLKWWNVIEWNNAILGDSLSAVWKPNFATRYSLEWRIFGSLLTRSTRLTLLCTCGVSKEKAMENLSDLKKSANFVTNVADFSHVFKRNRQQFEIFVASLAEFWRPKIVGNSKIIQQLLPKCRKSEENREKLDRTHRS